MNGQVEIQEEIPAPVLATMPLGRPAGGPAGGLSGESAIYLSLFLILLTFFLALVSMSDFDVRRVGPVIDSVQRSFGFRAASVRSEESLSQRLLSVDPGARLPIDPAFARQVEAAFDGLKAEQPFDGVPRSDAIIVPVKPGTLFVDGTAAIRTEIASLGERVAVVLNADPAQGARQLAVLVPPRTDRDLDVRQAAALMRLMQSAGVAPQDLRARVSDGVGDRIAFIFYVERKGGV